MSENLSELHWTVLRQKLSDLGLEYKGKEQAIAELSARAGNSPDQGAAGGAPAETTTEQAAVPKPRTKAVKGFDRDRPFGTITGEFEECPTARYVQDGTLYDDQGQKVG